VVAPEFRERERERERESGVLESEMLQQVLTGLFKSPSATFSLFFFSLNL
jgi:hypothetical protein